MADVLVYLYAVGGAALRAVLPGGLSGVGGAPVRVLVADRLAAAVSSVDPCSSVWNRCGATWRTCPGSRPLRVPTAR